MFLSNFIFFTLCAPGEVERSRWRSSWLVLPLRFFSRASTSDLGFVIVLASLLLASNPSQVVG
jgi:hypothetical protein